MIKVDNMVFNLMKRVVKDQKGENIIVRNLVFDGALKWDPYSCVSLSGTRLLLFLLLLLGQCVSITCSIIELLTVDKYHQRRPGISFIFDL